MSDSETCTVLCIASYEKGFEFMRQLKNDGCRVLLITSKSLQGVNWPRESIDEIYYMPDVDKVWNIDDLIHSVSYLARKEQIDRIVALDDYDVEKAARLREHLRVPGMGDTTARYFRDKLAMRLRAAEAGIQVPPFVHILNYDSIREYLFSVEPPYVLKPRMQAGAVGIKKISNFDELWRTLDLLGDKQSYYLLEKFIPGKIHHADSIVYGKKILFAIAHEYGLPPMEVAHEGRIFSTRTMIYGSDEEQEILAMNKKLLEALGLVQGISHTEFIRGSEDGKLYFLETSARVGGANIANLIEQSSGINLWTEWAKIETSYLTGKYSVPKAKKEYAGLMICLAKQEHPDLSSFNDPEVVWKLDKKNHAGLIVASKKYDSITGLLAKYSERFYSDFFTTAPMKDKASG